MKYHATPRLIKPVATIKRGEALVGRVVRLLDPSETQPILLDLGEISSAEVLELTTEAVPLYEVSVIDAHEERRREQKARGEAPEELTERLALRDPKHPDRLLTGAYFLITMKSGREFELDYDSNVAAIRQAG